MRVSLYARGDRPARSERRWRTLQFLPFRDARRELGVKHIPTRLYASRTYGKAEHFIQTALREWADALAYDTSEQRAEAFPAWTRRCNWQGRHGGRKSQTPIGRPCLFGDNLPRVHN